MKFAVTLVFAVTIGLAVAQETCMSMNGVRCVRRDQSSQTWALKKPGGDYCFDMFDNNVCFVDEEKPLVHNCNCEIAACGCPTAPPPTEEPAEETTTEEECEEETTTAAPEPEPTTEEVKASPPPPSKCHSDGNSLCMTKDEIKFYFDLDEYLTGGDPCFDTPITGTKRCIIRHDGWFTNWSWDTCKCTPECGCE